MSIQRFVTALLVLLFTAGCASAPPKAVRSEFEDIPVPKGLSYQADKSTIIESPTVKAARLVYRGRLEVDSLAYLSLEGLLRAVTPAGGSYCTSCYTGVYPVAFPKDEQSYRQLALKVVE